MNIINRTKHNHNNIKGYSGNWQLLLHRLDIFYEIFYFKCTYVQNWGWRANLFLNFNWNNSKQERRYLTPFVVFLSPFTLTIFSSLLNFQCQNKSHWRSNVSECLIRLFHENIFVIFADKNCNEVELKER